MFIPRFKHVNDILRSKKGGAHADRRKPSRSKLRAQLRKEL